MFVLMERDVFFDLVLQPMLKLLIESIKEEGRAKQNSFFTMTKKIIKMKSEFFLVPYEILK